MSDDLHALAGLYALDALDEVETARFERHLAHCDACATEVAEFREAAHRMGAADPVAVPAALRSRVLARTAATPQVRAVRARRSRRGPLAMVALGAAAALVAVTSLSVVLVRTRSDLAESRRLAAVLSDPDAAVVTHTGDSGVVARLVRSPDAATLVVMLGDLPAVGSDRAYAVWLIGESGPQPMALLRPDGNGRAVALIDTDVARFVGFGLTTEPAGGSPAPTGPLLVAGAVPGVPA